MKTKILISVVVLINLAAISLIVFGRKEDKANVEVIQSESNSMSQNIRPARSRGWSGDGLRAPETAVKNRLDEQGSGVATTEEFLRDINGDGVGDKITRTRVETGTAHGYDKYKIELVSRAGMIDITPEGFRTVEGADCMLKKFQFKFAPEFSVIVISRPWRDSWVTPTMATKTEYRVRSGRMEIVSTQNLREICDVSELF